MAYATEIIETSFTYVKSLFFPVRKKYWLRMGFLSMFTSGYSGGGGNGSGYTNSSDSELAKAFAGMDFRQALSQVNAASLDFLSKYGQILGVAVFLLYLFGLFFTYLSSILTFVFIGGIVKKDVEIRKGFSENKGIGTSLFFFRLVYGLAMLFIFLAILSPLLYYFFTNRLSEFNFWLLIPMGAVFLITLFLSGLFIFMVNDFVVPIMYMKRYTFWAAWAHFRKIAGKKKIEVLLYWLMKIVFSIASAIASLLLLIPILIIAALFVLLGIGIFMGMSAIAGNWAAVALTVVYSTVLVLVFIFSLFVVMAPIPAFFTVYSIEMIKKLEAVTLPASR